MPPHLWRWQAWACPVAGGGLRKSSRRTAHQPNELVPGVPEFYATSWEVAGVGSGLLAESFDGRPIKIEGNPSHPYNRTRSVKADEAVTPDQPSMGWGSADAYAQAQPLSLYDPERSRFVLDITGGSPVARDADYFDAAVLPKLQAALAAGKLAVLAEATASPTFLRLLKQLPDGAWHTWEPLRQTSGGTLPLFKFDKARVVLGLDCDYLGSHPGHTRYSADWSTLRATADDEGNPVMSRCYQVECGYSLTGASADRRLPCKPSDLATFATLVAGELGVEGGTAGEATPAMTAFAKEVAADLQAAGGEALVAAGPQTPAAVRRLADAINAKLGSVGTTVTYIADPVEAGGTIVELANKLSRGQVDALVILGGNPVYDAPADLDVATLISSVDTSVHLSPDLNETGLAVTCHVPRAHFLECWGDTRGFDGTVAPQQPLILPLFNGVSPIELLARVLGLEAIDGYTLVRETFGELTGGFDEKAFRKFLHDGILGDSAAEAVEPAIASGDDAVEKPDFVLVDTQAVDPDGVVTIDTFELCFVPDASVYDGRFANNGWLQELPDPLTKLCWDNAAMMNLADADELGIRTNDLVTISVNGRELTIAVYVMPGQPRGVIGLPLGYGRRVGGSLAVVGEDAESTGGGFDTYQLRTTGNLAYATGAAVEKTGDRYVLAMTQNHHLIDDTGYKGREKRVGKKGEDGKIIRETTFDRHAAYLNQVADLAGKPKPKGLKHPTKEHYDYAGVTLQIFQPPSEFNYPHAWGMSIDMNACTGCSACVVACQSENNIPVVGKESVLNNREMHWLRIDRYFKGDGKTVDEKQNDASPDVVWQPMMCVHCENAPCEQVCPVAATVHDTEGLNTMVYNRCIGTRYCSNNCPYKVRRFNYLDYHYKTPKGSTLDATFVGIPDQQQQAGIDVVKQMVFNPDVTVRMRGVMEKCTYCTQRIKSQTIYRKNRGETVKDGDIKTACQQACPTEAIVFGNLNDQTARVSRDQKQPRAFGVLDDLNTRPRTRYLAKLRNQPETAHAEGDDYGEHHETQLQETTNG